MGELRRSRRAPIGVYRSSAVPAWPAPCLQFASGVSPVAGSPGKGGGQHDAGGREQCLGRGTGQRHGAEGQFASDVQVRHAELVEFVQPLLDGEVQAAPAVGQ